MDPRPLPRASRCYTRPVAEPRNTWWSRWRHLLIPTLVAASATAAGSLIHLAFDVLPKPGQRPPPWLDRLPYLLGMLSLLTIPLWVWLAVKYRQRARGWPLAALACLHLAVIAGGLMGLLFSDPEFLFGRVHRGSLSLPDGRQAYLYSTGLFCKYEVYTERKGQIWIERVTTLSRKCEKDIHLAWSEEKGFMILDAKGREVPFESTNFNGLYWGPH